jgi:hypothetical protein
MRRGLLDRDGDQLRVWRLGTNHMILATHDELERVLAWHEGHHSLRLTVHQVDIAILLVLIRPFCSIQIFVGMLGKISLQELKECMQAARESCTQLPPF